MNKTTLTALLMLAGCDSSHDNDHEHGHGHEAPHDDQDGAHAHGDAHDTPAAAPAAPGEPVQAPLGNGTATLVPAAERVFLTLTDASGAPVSPTGEVRLALTPTDGVEQRVILRPDGAGWSGDAKAAGASGYVAVISRKNGEQTQTARLAWGDAPTAPTDAPEEPDHTHEGDKEHNHGHGH